MWAGFQWVSLIRPMLNYTRWASLSWLESALGSEVKPGSNPLCSAQYPHHCFGISLWTSSLLSWGWTVDRSLWSPAPLSWLCKRLLSILIIPGQERRHCFWELLFLPLGSLGLVWAVSSCSMPSVAVGFLGIFLVKHSWGGKSLLDIYGVLQGLAACNCLVVDVFTEHQY